MKNLKFLLLAVISLFITGLKTYGQPLVLTGMACPPIAKDCNNPVIVMPASSNLCPGTTFNFTPTITIPSGYTLINYAWSGAAGTPTLSPSSGTALPAATSVTVFTVCAAYTLTVSAISGTNLIQDGDFSQFRWVPSGPNYPDACSWMGCMESTYQTHGDCNGAMTPPDVIGITGTDGSGGVLCLPVEKGHTPPPRDWTYCLCVHSIYGVQPASQLRYFWGQTVDLCPNSDYILTYYGRPYATAGPGTQPQIEVLLGTTAAASSSSLEKGFSSGIRRTLSVDPIGPSSGGCNSMTSTTTEHWDEIIIHFNSGSLSGPTFICMHNTNYSLTASEFSIDDISLYRIGKTVQTINICPVPAPLSITPQSTIACVGVNFTFNVTANTGDKVYFNYTSPGCATVYSSSVVPTGGSFPVTIPGSCITTVGGMVCLNVTSITATATTSTGGTALCTMPLPRSRCIPISAGPTAGVITPAFVCVPPSTSFTVTTTSIGGTSFVWSIASGTTGGTFAGGPPTGATATINVTGPGTIILTCTVTNTCGSAVTTETVTINEAPSVINSGGVSAICTGQSLILSDAVAGGIWTSSNTALATVIATGSTTSKVTGANGLTSPAGVTITYTLPSGCAETKVITIKPTPYPIAGPLTMCPNSTLVLTDGPMGGAWSSSNTNIATIIGFEAVIPPIDVAVVSSGGTPGTTIITDNLNGCIATTTVIVSQPPPISGTPLDVCVGSMITLSDAAIGGGTWTSGSTGIATVDPNTGVATGVVAGTTMITFTSATTACTATATLTVNPIPKIIGSAVCVNSTITLSSTVEPGTWSSGSTTITIDAVTGVVTGVTAGTAVVTFTSSFGCIGTKIITVHPLPDLITGPAEVCVGSTITLSDNTPGGIWTSIDPAIAVIDPVTGVLTGVQFGPVMIDYTSTVTGCSATYTVMVKDVPAVDFNIVSPTAYLGCPFTMSAQPGVGITSGGSVVNAVSWTSSDPTVATILINLPWTGPHSTAVFTPIATGTVTITYSATNDCGPGSISYTVVVLPTPTVTITPPAPICAGTTISLIATPGGGTWSGASAGVANVRLNGITTGIGLGGIDVLTYYLPLYPGTCVETGTTTLTVNPQPGQITGPRTICTAGGTIVLSDRMPGGTWNSNDWSVATVVASGPGAGTVTAGSTSGSVAITYMMPGGCYSVAIVKILIGAPECVCDYIATHPDVDVNELEPAHTGLLSSNPTPGGYYYLNHDISIDPLVHITMLNNVVVISPSVTITVNSFGKLTCVHSHLFCCPGYMWEGIRLNTYLPHAGTGGGIGPTGQLVLANNAEGSTMIEDARIAVLVGPKINPAYFPFFPGNAFLALYCNGVTFNKNGIGIEIANPLPGFTIIPVPGDPASEHPGYPYVIQNTVFTSRNFYPYTTISSTGAILPWPAAWPDNVLGIAPLKGPVLPILVPPYAPYGVDLYPSAPCNDGTRPTCGVYLQNMGAVDVPGTYSSVVIGSPYTTSPIATYNEKNVFDNMQYGILAMNSNVVSRNNVYMNMYRDPKGGIGIYSYRDATTSTNNYALDVYGTNSSWHNEFYNCREDVKAEDLYHVRGIYSQMQSRHTSTVPMDVQGSYGYDVTASQYDHIELDHNTIYNIKTAISSQVVAPAAGTGALYVGEMSASHNTIRLHAGGGAATHNEYTQTAIQLQALVPPYTGGVVAGSQINADYNTIDHAYNGIVLTGFPGPIEHVTVKTTVGNEIIITPDIMTGYYEQAGILHDDNMKDWIVSNTVIGPDAHIPLPSVPTYTVTASNIIEGIHCSALFATNICSNTTNKTNTGIYFNGLETIYNWISNTMTNHAFGYVLAGTISTQPYGGYGAYVTGNMWTGTWGGGYTGGGTDWQTYTIGNPDITSGIGSPMLVSGIYSVENPTYNAADFGSLFSSFYSSTNGLIVDMTGLTSEPCFSIPATSEPAEYRHRHNPDVVPAIYSYAARKKMGYVANAAQKNWISQMAVWRAIASDSTVDTSAVLHTFKQMAANSRYKNLTDIEHDIATGNYDAATTLLANQPGYMASSDSDAATGVVMADNAGDNVVANYRQYYQLLIKYRTSALNSDDSAKAVILANKCPSIDGSVIYDARAFYNLIFHDSRLFNDAACEPMIDVPPAIDIYGNSGTTHDDSTQNYVLWPNPSDGNITLSQKIPDGPAKVEVWNSIGQNMYRGEVYFAGGQARIKVNAASGVYLLHITDHNGKGFILKFVIDAK